MGFVDIKSQFTDFLTMFNRMENENKSRSTDCWPASFLLIWVVSLFPGQNTGIQLYRHKALQTSRQR